MTFEDYVKALQERLNDRPDIAKLTVNYTIDDELNHIQEVHANVPTIYYTSNGGDTLISERNLEEDIVAYIGEESDFDNFETYQMQRDNFLKDFERIVLIN